ncbi:hypothetical protein PIB30_017401 [Stylosanthes scabra]|uniref:Uncharacterized protein n=1 Tax=Stylosanthes scabra TaxID=79078 RepID=A0ABU6W612_9FABA|nr:hypothetical protein [Stylosanthes scabra]
MLVDCGDFVLVLVQARAITHLQVEKPELLPSEHRPPIAWWNHPSETTLVLVLAIMSPSTQSGSHFNKMGCDYIIRCFSLSLYIYGGAFRKTQLQK